MKTIILLDVDIPVFFTAALHQRMVPSWTSMEGTELEVDDIEKAKVSLDKYVAKLKRTLGADEVVMCLSEPVREKNWRRDVLPTYKDNRSKTAAPVLRAPLNEYVEATYRSYLKETLEGDDVLGILATNNKVIKGRKILVSGDKDLRTIPSRKSKGSENWMFNPDKDKVPYWNHLWMADHFWMYQTLIGDTTDHYTGLPKCGPKCADKVIGEEASKDVPLEDLWLWVVNEYVRRGSDEAAAIIQAQVARIARDEDFNYKTQRVTPWLPNF